MIVLNDCYGRCPWMIEVGGAADNCYGWLISPTALLQPDQGLADTEDHRFTGCVCSYCWAKGNMSACVFTVYMSVYSLYVCLYIDCMSICVLTVLSVCILAVCLSVCLPVSRLYVCLSLRSHAPYCMYQSTCQGDYTFYVYTTNIIETIQCISFIHVVCISNLWE